MTEPTRDDAKALVAAVEALTERIAERFVTAEEYQRNRRNVRAALVVVVVAVVLLVVVVISNRAVLDEARHQTDVLTECTTPDDDPTDSDDHECYDRGQAAQADAIAQVVDAIRQATAAPTPGG